ncbi:MAG TPA: hypothetical protein VFE42_17125 [Chloroflexota bacterium]|nr:hypothetical protein [Chloroflexota bacterium]
MRRVTDLPAPDSTIHALATELAATAADALERAGLPLSALNAAALGRALSKALEHVVAERERAVRQARLDQRARWVQEQGLLSAADVAQHLGLTPLELDTAQALALVVPVDIPPDLLGASAHFTAESWRYYRPGIALSDDARARIAHETLLTRLQAAERLGVSVSEFDRLRKERGLTDVAHTGSTDPSPKRYRTAAVLQLTADPVPPDWPVRLTLRPRR